MLIGASITRILQKESCHWRFIHSVHIYTYLWIAREERCWTLRERVVRKRGEREGWTGGRDLVRLGFTIRDSTLTTSWRRLLMGNGFNLLVSSTFIHLLMQSLHFRFLSVTSFTFSFLNIHFLFNLRFVSEEVSGQWVNFMSPGGSHESRRSAVWSAFFLIISKEILL